MAPPKPQWTQAALAKTEDAIAELMPAGFAPRADAPSTVEEQVDDPYDPSKPNDYVELQREHELKRAQERRERERQRHLERIEQEQERLAEERREAARREMNGLEPPTKKKFARGISNLPAWMKTYKKDEAAVVEEPEPTAEVPPPPPPPEQPVEEEKKNEKKPQQKPTPVLVLTNMTEPGTPADPDLAAETRQECEAKYGPVTACLVVDTPDPRLFVKFTKKNDAVKAFLDMRGRFFSGRQIACAFFDEFRFDENDLRSDL